MSPLSVCCIAVCFISSLIAQEIKAQDVLFVTGSTRLSQSDNLVKRDLTSLGMQVQVVSDIQSQASDADAKDLVLISESALSSRVGSKLSRVAVPLVVYESHLFDDLGMSGKQNGSYGNRRSQKSLTIQGRHALTGGFDGSVTVASTGVNFSWARPGAEAVVAATLSGDSSRATIFGYESGALLANGETAPARRVGVFPGVGALSNRTPTGKNLFLSAIRWALSTPAVVETPQPVQSLKNQPPEVSAGRDQEAVTGVGITLEGVVSDDGLTDTLSVRWEVPDSVTVDKPSSDRAQMTFASAGTFQLQLIASDGEHTVRDTVVVTVENAVSPSESDDGVQVLFVTGNTSLSPGDAIVKRDLESQGMTVFVVSDSQSKASDTTAKDLVVISESVLSSRVGRKLNGVDVPMVVYESHLYDDLGMSANKGGNYGNSRTAKSLAVQGSHPLTGGLSGQVVVSKTGASFSWAIPGDEAIVAAALTSDSTRATVFGYEAGARLANGTKSPARRVGLYPHKGSVVSRTIAGRDLFLAGVQWALGSSAVEPIAAIEPEDQPNVVGEPSVPVIVAPPELIDEPAVETPVAPIADAPQQPVPLEANENSTAADSPVSPAEPPSVVEQLNNAPQITDTSYQCDPVIESVAFKVGQTDNFTLSVDDESPLTLKYMADSSNSDIVGVSVDDNGIFTVTALRRGDSFLWLTAEDETGLADEYELRVIVE